MARARNIKPGFFANEDLVELPFQTRLLFIGLWTLCDREGRAEDRPKRIKMAVFPADNVDVDECLNQLQERGFLIRYEAEGSQYIQVLMFKKHQNPHKDERQSTIPAPCEHGASTVQPQEAHSANLADSPIPDSPIPEKKPLSASADIRAVFDHWKQVMDSPKSNLDAKRKSAIEARLKDGFTVEDLKTAIDGCRKTPHNMGDNDRGQKFNDIELICRNAPNVERFMNATGASPPKTKPDRPLTAADKYAAQRDAMRANHERTITGTATRIA